MNKNQISGFTAIVSLASIVIILLAIFANEFATDLVLAILSALLFFVTLCNGSWFDKEYRKTTIILIIGCLCIFFATLILDYYGLKKSDCFSYFAMIVTFGSFIVNIQDFEAKRKSKKIKKIV
ncbi:hypothetical protein [Anaerorhabdus sp.]|uniref:hypothetical protein n=1 Tax=Anaerorhabdus sp. TaxID=1872524 RepID=UPI002FCA8EFD